MFFSVFFHPWNDGKSLFYINFGLGLQRVQKDAKICKIPISGIAAPRAQRRDVDFLFSCSTQHKLSVLAFYCFLNSALNYSIFVPIIISRL